MTKAIRTGITFLIFIIICFSHTNALATTTFSLSKPKVWTSGMEVNASSASNLLNISLDSVGIENGINTSYVFDTDVSFPESTSSLKFHINQKSTGDLWLDFILEDINKTKKTLSFDGAAILHRDSSDESEIVKLNSLSLNLGHEFNGDVYIPFRYLKVNESDPSTSKKDFKINKLASAGFVFTIGGDESSKIEIENLTILNGKDDPYVDEMLDANIAGEDALPISDVAESISQYSITGAQKNDFSFVPIDGSSGVSITRDGVFSTMEYAEEQGIGIRAVNKDGLYISKTVKIYKSWASTQDDPKMKIPEPNKIESIKDTYSMFSNKQVLKGIRLSCIIVVFIFGLSYYLSNRKFKG